MKGWKSREKDYKIHVERTTGACIVYRACLASRYHCKIVYVKTLHKFF